MLRLRIRTVLKKRDMTAVDRWTRFAKYLATPKTRETMLVDLHFRLILLFMFLGGMGMSSVLRRRADRAGGRVPRSADRRSTAVALRIAGSVFYGSLLAWLLYPPLLEWAGVMVGDALRWMGVGLTAAGIGLGLWSVWHLGGNVTPTAVARRDARLVESGPYRRVRHPLYGSMLLTVPGCGLVTGNALVLAGGLAAFAILLLRTRREEEQLLERFGRRYAEYARRAGRILPRLRSPDSDVP